LENAIRRHGAPEIFNTDQGSQFTSTDFIAVLKQHDIKISMDGKGRWMDNVFIERLWRSVKYEDIYIKEYMTVVALKLGLKTYFAFYNDERPHQSFGVYTPTEMYSCINKLAA
jgi:putative transposase